LRPYIAPVRRVLAGFGGILGAFQNRGPADRPMLTILRAVVIELLVDRPRRPPPRGHPRSVLDFATLEAAETFFAQAQTFVEGRDGAKLDFHGLSLLWLCTY
jgi:hypothetical protein